LAVYLFYGEVDMALIPCPECKTEISDMASSCPKCGFPIATKKEKPKTAAVPPPPPAFNPLHEKVCPGCKAVIANDLFSCPKCGFAFHAPGATPASLGATRGPWRAQSFSDNFLGILTEPRKTFGYILQGPHFEGTWSMLLLLAVLQFIQTAQKGHFILGLIMIPVFVVVGYLALWIGAWIYYHVGGWFGGKGSRDDLFDYGVWASAASAVGSVVTIIKNLVHLSLWQLPWKVIGWGVGIWALIISIILLSTAHRFSIGRAILVQVTIVAVAFGLLLIVLLAFGISLPQIIHEVIKG
jgi:hypothetical protein